MEMKFELVPVPVADIDPAKDFFVDRLGFNVDVDVRPADGVRVVQLTPLERLHRPWRRAADDCDGTGVDQGLHLVVRNIAEARDTLAGRGVEVGDVDEQAQGVKYAVFSDPEGNTWALQAMPWRSQAWS